MAVNFNKLKVIEKRVETTDSRSFLLDLPTNIAAQYNFKAGQYLTLKFDINGQEHRRSYSIFTAPYDKAQFGFTVKRVEKGLISNHLIDNIKEGDEIEVMTPEGKFVLETERQLHRDHYFIAGGSGITPVMSMILNVLEEEPLSTCNLLYANRNESCIIFNEQLTDLANKYQDQFTLTHILSQPAQEKAGGIKGLFGKKAEAKWKGLKGRINTNILDRYFDEFPSKSQSNLYYLCGPTGLIQTMETYLGNKQIDSATIKKEYFTVETKDKVGATNGQFQGSATAEVKLNGEKFTMNIPADKTVLDALIDLGKDPPYSCTSGACSTCIAKVTDGKVEMEACFALDDEEVAEGYVLTCQAHVTTEKLKIDYES